MYCVEFGVQGFVGGQAFRCGGLGRGFGAMFGV